MADPQMPAETPSVAVVRPPQAVKAACGILVLEALALTAAAAFLVFATITGQHAQVARSLLGAAMALLGAWALVAGARSLLRLRPAARSPMVVLQLLALPVAYSLAIQAGRVVWGGPILVAALATLFLLFTPPARAALDRTID